MPVTRAFRREEGRLWSLLTLVNQAQRRRASQRAQRAGTQEAGSRSHASSVCIERFTVLHRSLKGEQKLRPYQL